MQPDSILVMLAMTESLIVTVKVQGVAAFPQASDAVQVTVVVPMEYGSLKGLLSLRVQLTGMDPWHVSFAVGRTMVG